MPTTVHHAHNGADTPITTLPVEDEQAYPYLPPSPRYRHLYRRLRTGGVSVAEALLAALKAYHLDLTAAIIEYEATHIVTS